MTPEDTDDTDTDDSCHQFTSVCGKYRCAQYDHIDALKMIIFNN